MSDQHKVAIVDDVAASSSTKALLELAGYGVRTFVSGDEFLAAQPPGDWDCVVLDIHTAGINGIGLLKALGAGKAMPPVLVLTGQGAIAEAVEAMKLGAADFLEKPYPAESFLEAIGRALASGPRRKEVAVDRDAAARIAALPQRQAQVLRGILKGQPNKIIAYELGLSIRTVEAYRAQLLDRLGVRGTAAAVRLAIAAGMLETI
jgi:two-component system response regulator FixJ